MIFFKLKKNRKYIGQKAVSCCIGVTWPTLKLGPTLDIFLIKKKKEKKKKIKRLKVVLHEN